jgi:Holliday junction resolvase RusA-like endonuclease
VYTITVFGVPAPQGSKRHVGNGRLIEASPRLRPWREDVKQAALDARTETLQGPVSVEIAFTFNKPKSAPKTKVTYPITRSSGDLDKLCRSVLDALVDAGIMRDDSQVIDLAATKSYIGWPGGLDLPGAVINVREVNA